MRAQQALETLNLVAMSLNGAQAIAVATFDRWLDDASSSSNNDDEGKIMLRRPASDSAGWLDVRWVTCACFALSMAGQAYAVVYQRRGRAGPLLRFAQHSITSGLMVMAMAAQIGLRDLYTLECMFVLLWATQAFGLASETAQTRAQPWLPCLALHAAGWVTCLAAFVPLLAASFTLPQPRLGRVIVWCEFGLFGAMGAVQLALLLARGSALKSSSNNNNNNNDDGDNEEEKDDDDGDAFLGGVVEEARCYYYETRAELAYVGLTALAKSLLCWLIMSPILASAV